MAPRLPKSVPSVDAVGLEARAASFTTRSIKAASKVHAMKMVVGMTDLTTLAGADTPGKVESLCAKALRPLPHRVDVPSTAAVCVYPPFVPQAKQLLSGSGVKVAAVATYFPSGQASLQERIDEVLRTVAAGADEIDMVIRRGDYLSGRYDDVFDDIVAVKKACGPARLKVILETGELMTYDNVRFASQLAMEAGADFIKTSTGKVNPAATMPVTLLMLEAIRDYHRATGRMVGMKPAGGIRTSKQAVHYLVMVRETLGQAWLDPAWFRFGASSLLNDVLMQLEKERTGHYMSPDSFSSTGAY
ncbi:MAG: deoxyribose-phosphate aldolase [Myxococcales bacterium]|nr:deoxyribose-phosphate aldolase [Myxococcales bacterium]